jgi:hypothetical protein
LYTSDLGRAYLALGREPNVTAVLDATISDRTYPNADGGYYFFHRPVPIYFPDEVAEKGFSPAQALAAVSHVVCKAGTPPFAGFAPFLRFGSIEVRAQIERSNRAGLAFDSFNVLLLRRLESVVKPNVNTFPAAHGAPQ